MPDLRIDDEIQRANAGAQPSESISPLRINKVGKSSAL